MSDEATTTEEETAATEGMAIDDATPDTSVGGSELIPVSDAGQPKAISVAQIKDFVLAQITGASAASTVSLDGDKVYLLQGGALKPLTAATLATAVLNAGFGHVAVAEINGNEVISVKDSSAQKTITVAALQAYLEENLDVEADLDISELSAASTPLETTDLLVVARGSTNGKLSIADFSAWCLARFAAFVTALTAAVTVGNDDVIYILQGGTAKKATVAQIKTALGAGDVTGPDSTTENYVPQWDATTKKLKNGVALTTTIDAEPTGTKIPTEGAVRTAIDAMGDTKAPTTTTAGKIPVWSSTGKKLDDGKTVQTTVRAAANASDDAIPTEKAVRTALDANGGVAGPGVTTENNVPQWDGTQKTLKNGLSVQQTVRNSANASHTALATEKAVRDAVDGCITAPVSHTEDAIPTWGAGAEMKPGKSVTTVIASTGSDDKIPTEKAVRDALPVAATTAAAGLMSAADKAKLDGLADTGSVAEIGEALTDNDTVVVKKGDALYRKSLLSRFWTYILGKLPTVRIDQFSDCVDGTNGNASTSAHGLLKKLDGNNTHFLRGDGEWAEPSGSTEFTGDTGSGGAKGLVPAPASGDAAANKFLCADGSWAETPAAAGVNIPGANPIDALAGSDAFYAYDASAGSYVRVSAAQIAAFMNGLTRYETLFIPAGAFTPSNVGGAAMSALRFTNNTHDVATFPADEDAFVEFNVAMPDDWDAQPFKAKVHWTCNSASAENDQTAMFTLGAVAFSDGDAITDAPATSVEIVDAMLAANELHVSGASDAIAPDGEGGKFLHFKLGRDVSEGTLAQPVQVLGVMLQFGRKANAAQW